MNSQDLGGSKIVFKVKLDKEIKKLVIHNDDINYNELLLMMQRIFSDKIRPLDEISIKYTDEENDLITLSNDSDVLLALQNSKILKLTIFLNNKEEEAEELKPADIVKELTHIRSSIDSFLQKFDTLLRSDKYKPKIEELAKSVNDVKLKQSNGQMNSNILNAHKEFDPLARNVENRQSNVSKRVSRDHTPDSVGSNELSPNPKKCEQPTSQHQNLNSTQQHQQQYANLNLNSLNGNDKPVQQHANGLNEQNIHQFSQQHQQSLPFQQFSQQAQTANQLSQQSQPQIPSSVQLQHQQPSLSIHAQQAQLQPQHQQQMPPVNQQPTLTGQFYPNIAHGQPGPGQKPNQPVAQAMPYQNVQNLNPNPGQMDPIAQQQQQQQQQLYQPQQPQPHQQNWNLQQSSQQPQQQIPMPNQQNSGYNIQQPVNAPNNNNPYAKPPAATVLHRPASTTMYQQGYK